MLTLAVKILHGESQTVKPPNNLYVTMSFSDLTTKQGLENCVRVKCDIESCGECEGTPSLRIDGKASYQYVCHQRLLQ